MRVPHIVYPGLMKPSTNQPSVNRTGPATAPSANPTKRLRVVVIVVCPLLRQAHLEADPRGCDLTCLERTLRDEKLELKRGVRAVAKPLQRRLRREGAQPAEVHAPHLFFYGGVGGVVAHVLDRCGPTSAKDAVHLGERGARQREVLESGLADDQVERVGLERNLRHVALLEIDADSLLARAVAPDLNERVADVEGCHIKTTKASHLDGQVAGTSRHLQHSCAIR